MSNPQSVGVGCASLIGFFSLLRVGGIENLRWADVTLPTDCDGELCIRLLLPRSKTDQYNEGHAKTLKAVDRPSVRPMDTLSG